MKEEASSERIARSSSGTAFARCSPFTKS